MVKNTQQTTLLQEKPEYVVSRAEPGELLAELRGRGPLLPGESLTLDFVLRQWTLQALARQGDLEGLLDLHDLAGVALRLLPDDAESATFRTRWQAFRDLVESKRLALGSRQSGRARSLLHCQPILNLLAERPRPQSELQEHIRLSAQRLSQVLGVMEEGGLIQREKRGKEKLVFLATTSALRAAEVPRTPRSAGHIVWGGAFGVPAA